MTESNDHLHRFELMVEHIKEDPFAEEFCRRFINGRNYPIDLLKEIGKVIIEYRRNEMRNDAKRN